ELEASSAQVVEAVRLAEGLAALRERPLVGLAELDEAAQSVLCAGQQLPMDLVRTELTVGEVLGAVPDETPMVPLAQDLDRERRRLRLEQDPKERHLDLDLRNPNARARSHLLHRLLILG